MSKENNVSVPALMGTFSPEQGFPENPQIGELWIISSNGKIGDVTVAKGDRALFTGDGWYIILGCDDGY